MPGKDKRKHNTTWRGKQTLEEILHLKITTKAEVMEIKANKVCGMYFLNVYTKKLIKLSKNSFFCCEESKYFHYTKNTYKLVKRRNMPM